MGFVLSSNLISLKNLGTVNRVMGLILIYKLRLFNGHASE